MWDEKKIFDDFKKQSDKIKPDEEFVGKMLDMVRDEENSKNVAYSFAGKSRIILGVAAAVFVAVIGISIWMQQNRSDNNQKPNMVVQKITLVDPKANAGKNSSDEINGSISRNTSHILFIYREIYFGEGFHNAGFFVDQEGYKYSFDLTDKGQDYLKNDGLYSYLCDNMNSFEREQYISKEDAQKCNSLLIKIPSDYEVSEEYTGSCDAGEYYIEGVVQKEGENPLFIMLREKGDSEKENKDSNAKQILEILGKNDELGLLK